MRDLMLKQKMVDPVLVVDDEPAVLELHSRVLQKYNIPVFAAKDGAEALDIFLKEKNIHIVVTDINMPKMNGIELILQVLKHNPLTQIVVITAYLDDTLALYGVKSNVVCLPKPMEPEFIAIAALAGNMRYQELSWQKELKAVTSSSAWDEKTVLEIIKKAPWIEQSDDE